VITSLTEPHPSQQMIQEDPWLALPERSVAVNEQVVAVTITVVRKLKMHTGRFVDDEDEHEYDIWVIGLADHRPLR